MSELTLEQALILLDESRQHNAAMLDRLYESLGIDSSDGEMRLKWAMIAIEDVKRERDNALAQNAELLAMIESLRKLFPLKVLVGCDGHLSYPVSQYNDVVEAFNKTPTQHLRDRDAEVGRAGFVAGACSVLPVYSTMEMADIEADARNYAEKVRMGEV